MKLLGRMLAWVAASAIAGDVPVAYRPPDVDGRPLEDVWERGLVIDDLRDETTRRVDGSTRVVLLASERGIEALYECREPLPLRLGIARQEGSATTELPDDVSLVLHGGGEKVELTVTSRGEQQGTRSTGAGLQRRDLSKLSWAAAVHSEGATWWVEASIPWNLLPASREGLEATVRRRDWVDSATLDVRRASSARRQMTLPPPPDWPPPPPDSFAWDGDASASRALLRGTYVALTAWLHAPGGSAPLTVRADSSHTDVGAEVFVVPAWRQAGRGTLAESHVPGAVSQGGGDVTVRELWLKSRAVPPRDPVEDGAPATLALLPDHREMIVVRLRIDSGARSGAGTVTVTAQPEVDGKALRLSAAFDVVDVPEPHARQRHGIYLGTVPSAEDVRAIAALGMSDVVLSTHDAAGVSAAVSAAGLRATVIDVPARRDELRPSDAAYGYGVDEPFTPVDHARCRDLFQRYRAMGLGTTTAITEAASLAALSPLLDRPIVNIPLVHDLRDADLGALGVRERWYYWQMAPEEPTRHRLLAGFYLWVSGFDGVMPYAWRSPSGDAWDDWDGGVVRDDSAVYPAGEGAFVWTWQLMGLAAGIADIRAVTALEETLAQARAKGRGGSQAVADAEKTLRSVRAAFGRPYRELLDETDAGDLDRFRTHLLRAAERLSRDGASGASSKKERPPAPAAPAPGGDGS